jgi:hypothetical protein
MVSKPSEPMKINKAFDRCGGAFKGAFFAILLTVPVIQSQAQTLTVGSTSLQVNLGPSAGLSNWTIDGVNQLDYQWFYYSVGSGAIASIDSIGSPGVPEIINSSSTAILNETYTGTTVGATALFELEGASSASGSAKLATTITLKNLGSTAQTFNLYQFSDFDLGNTPGNQNVQFAGTGAPYQVTQTGIAGGGPLVGTLNAGFATVGEAAGIEDGNQLGILSGNANPNLNSTSLSATGAVDFAYEISETLNPNQSIIISELQSAPEPSTTMLVLPGILAFGLLYGRKLTSLKKDIKKASV